MDYKEWLDKYGVRLEFSNGRMSISKGERYMTVPYRPSPLRKPEDQLVDDFFTYFEAWIGELSGIVELSGEIEETVGDACRLKLLVGDEAFEYFLQGALYDDTLEVE